VIANILGGLDIVPLEVQIHDTTGQQ